jgi:hypothetical protein
MNIKIVLKTEHKKFLEFAKFRWRNFSRSEIPFCYCIGKHTHTHTRGKGKFLNVANVPAAAEFQLFNPHIFTAVCSYFQSSTTILCVHPLRGIFILKAASVATCNLRIEERLLQAHIFSCCFRK